MPQVSEQGFSLKVKQGTYDTPDYYSLCQLQTPHVLPPGHMYFEE